MGPNTCFQMLVAQKSKLMDGSKHCRSPSEVVAEMQRCKEEKRSNEWTQRTSSAVEEND